MILLRGIRGTVKDYVALTKPPIVVLLLVTTLAGMILGEGGIRRLGRTVHGQAGRTSVARM